MAYPNVAEQLYLSGQGPVGFALRDLTTGLNKALEWFGNAPTLTWNASEESESHKESYSGKRTQDIKIFTGQELGFSLTVENFNKKTIQKIWQGVSTALGTTAVVNELLATGVLPGDTYALSRQNVSAVSISDSAGTPATLAAAHYAVNGPRGLVEFLKTPAAVTAIGAAVQPFKVNFTPAAATMISLLNGARVRGALRMDVINTADSDRETFVELYDCELSLPQNFDFIVASGVAQFTIEGSVRADATKGVGFGQYGRLIYPD